MKRRLTMKCGNAIPRSEWTDGDRTAVDDFLLVLRLDFMSVAELREVARKRGYSTITKLDNHGELKRAICKMLFPEHLEE